MKKFSTLLLLSFLGIILSAFVVLAANPTITLSPISPTVICSTGNDTLVYSVESSAIPPNTNVVIYQSSDSTFNPYLGQGDSIGYVKGDTATTSAITSVCPKILGIFIDACNDSGRLEPANEYMVITSGKGFKVSNLKIDLPNTSLKDINMGPNPCSFGTPSATLMTSLRTGFCNSSNLLSATQSDSIPPNALVIVFTGAGTDYPYNLSRYCQTGQKVYILQNACTNSSGAFVNNDAAGTTCSSTNGTTRYRTTTLSNRNCFDELTYDRCGLNEFDGANPNANDGNYVVRLETTDTSSVANGGIQNNATDRCNGVVLDSIVRTQILKFPVSQNFCNTGKHFIKAITHPNGTQPISNTISFQLICNDVRASTSTTTICSGDSVKIGIASTDPNATFTWTVAGSTAISGQAAGTGNSIKQVLTFTGTSKDSITYNITSNDATCSKSTSVKVVVNNCKVDCNPTITGNKPFCQGDSIILDAGAGFTSYSWNTGAQTQTIVAKTSGKYTVSVIGQGCTGKDSVNVVVNDIPQASISGNTTFCNSSSTTLSVNGQFDSVRWSTNQTTTSITVNQIGTFGVTVYKNGCSGFASVDVVQDLLQMEITGDQILCGGSTGTLIATAGFDHYYWSNGDTTRTISITSASNYSVTGTTAGGCSATASFEVSRISIDYSLSSHTQAICQGDTAKFVLSQGDLGSSPVDTFEYTQPGKYYINYQTPRCGVYRDSVTVTLNSAVTPVITGNLRICTDESTTLDAGEGFDSYSWQPNEEQSQTISVSTIGKYIVTVTKRGFCAGSDTVDVIQASSPTAFNLGNDTAFCGPFSKVLSTGNQATVWNTDVTSAQITVTQAGTYIATISSNCGLVSDTIVISQNPIPAVFIGNDTTFCDGELLLNAPSEMRSYVWNTGATSQSITVSQEGTYSVKITDANNCSNSDSINVASNCLNDIWIPNAFSPNGDGVNDVFVVRGNPRNSTIEKMLIYNRWGNKVFEANNILPDDKTTGWNGTYKGADAQFEVYGYYVVVRFKDGSKQVLKGNVTLVK